MAGKLPSLGELEMQVLRVVWNRAPCTEREVFDVVRRRRRVGRTTVLKTIQRLEAKGLLVRKAKKTGPVEYRAAVAERRVLPAIVRRFVERTLAGSLEPLVNYLADGGKLSAKDLAALRAIARKMAKDDKT
jgi:predicted transcriptional regulator